MGATRCVLKTKVAIHYIASPVIEYGAFFYSKAKQAMQARGAAGATSMHITPGRPIRSQEQFEWMRQRVPGACMAATVILGIGAGAGRSQQAQEKPHELELSRSVRLREFLPIAGTSAGRLGKGTGRL